MPGSREFQSTGQADDPATDDGDPETRVTVVWMRERVPSHASGCCSGLVVVSAGAARTSRIWYFSTA